MASRISKRKSPCQDTIFLEVNDNDLSPEPHSHEDSEPDIKIMKTETDTPSAVLEDQALLSSLTETIVVHNPLPTEFVLSCEEPDNVSSEESENVSCENHSVFAKSNNIEEGVINTESKDVVDGHENETINKKENIMNTKLTENAEICISFGNKQLSDLYKLRFKSFLKSFVELEIVKETELSITFQRDSILNPSDWIVLDETFDSNQNVQEKTHITLLASPSKSRKKKTKKKKKDDDLFVLDTNPSQDEPTSHNTKYLSTFQIDIDQQGEDDTHKVMNQTCFNCNGKHNLKDCPLPKNQSRINDARNKFKAQKQTT